MIIRHIIGCAVVAATLAFTVTPVRACEGLACLFAEKTETPSAPLKLDTFMRRKATNAKSGQRAGEKPTAATARKPTKAVKRPGSGDLTTEVARTLSLPVRVVASDELNEIDLRADPPPGEQTPTAFAAETTGGPIAANGVDDVDRNAEAMPPPLPVAAKNESAVAATNEREQAADRSSTPDNWALRVWVMLQAAFSAVAAAARWLVA